MSDPHAASSAEAPTLVGDDETARPGARAGTGPSYPGGPDTASVGRGSVLGRYIVVDRIGAGAMGVVYEAYDPKLDRKVALKILTGGHLRGEDAQTRLLREAQALAKLSHPNVVAVHDVHELDGLLAVAMAFIDGITLRSWAKAAPRSYKEVLDVARQAGRGLAAAHAAGLVHRDFKPDNAMIDSSGRVFVVDLGLAAFFDPTTLDRSPDGDPERTAFVGTPAYMAPEQHDGRRGDPRSDQFSFCATIYEALYGQRAFAGESLVDVVDAITSGRVAPPPPGIRVPRWFHATLMRGLARDPAQRFASMDALLAALDRRPRKVVPLAVGGVVLGIGLFAQAWVGSHGDAMQCRADDRLAGTWDASMHDALARAFARPDRDYLDDLHPRVQDGLDAYASAWTEQSIDNCEATWVRGEQSPELLDLRTSCLDEARNHLSQVVALLTDDAVDLDTLSNAIDMVDGLPDLGRCRDVAALRARIAPPSDSSVARAVDDGRKGLARAAALDDAGRYTEAETVSSDVLARARELGYRPFVAEALVEHGVALQDAGRFEEAERALSEGGLLAHRIGHDRVAARAFTRMVSVAASREASWDAAASWVRLADAAVGRIDDLEAFATLRRLRARLLSVHERNLEAELDLRVAFAAAEHIGASPGERAAISNTLATVLESLGRIDDALASYERARALAIEATGPRHPNVAGIESNMGDLLSEYGRLQQGLQHSERALEIYTAALGDEHPTLANAWLNVAVARSRANRLDDAAAAIERAVELATAAYGPKAPQLAQYEYMAGTIAYLRDDVATARTRIERAVQMHHDHFGPDHPGVAAYLTNLASIERRAGNVEAAARRYREVLAIYDETLGPDHPERATVLYGLGLAEQDQGEDAAALQHLENALRIRREHGDDAGTIAENEFFVAQLRYELGIDRPGALQMAERAIERGEHDPELDIEAMRAWLAARRPAAR